MRGRGKIAERISRAFSRVLNRDMLLALLVGSSILMFSGVVFLAVEQPPAVVGYGETLLFIWPYGVSSQTGFETFGAFFLLTGGFAGLFLMYHSSRKIYEPKYASFLLLIGVALFLLTFIGVNLLIRSKGISI